MSRLLKGLIPVFCCWHAAFLIYSVIPAPPARDHPVNPAMELYRLAFSGQEQWNMFNTIPTMHSMDWRLESEDEMGRKETVGCVLPGFTPYPLPERSRYYMLFFGLLYLDNKVVYREAYLRKVGQLLAQRSPGVDRKWSFVSDVTFTRNLYYSRRDGGMVVPKTFEFVVPRPGSD